MFKEEYENECVCLHIRLKTWKDAWMRQKHTQMPKHMEILLGWLNSLCCLSFSGTTCVPLESADLQHTVSSSSTWQVWPDKISAGHNISVAQTTHREKKIPREKGVSTV